MRTVRCSDRSGGVGGVPAGGVQGVYWGGCLLGVVYLPRGVYLPGRYLPKGYLPGMGYLLRRILAQGGVPAQGVYLPGGVPAKGVYLPRGCTCPGGVPDQRGVYLPRDVCIPACSEADPPCEKNDWQRGVKTLPCYNFVADGNQGPIQDFPKGHQPQEGAPLTRRIWTKSKKINSLTCALGIFVPNRK